MFDADESERMHDSFTALSHARMMQLRNGHGHGGCHRLQAAQQPPMRPSIPPPPPTTMVPSPPLTPQPVHRRRPASPFRMSQG